MSAVSSQQRHTRQHRCPVCNGADGDPRGKELRCSGFTSVDGEWTHCSRPEHSGSIDQNGAGLFAHKMHGECRCGSTHGADLRPSQVQAKRIAATYDYVDEKGALLLQVVRYEPKEFRQRKPDGAGGWIWKVGDVRRVPYRLPQLIEGARSGATIYIVEGEKDVDTLTKCGLIATTNAGGVGKWSAIESVIRPLIINNDVTIIADADVPGRSHAQRIFFDLLRHNAVRRVRLMEAPAPHKDVTAFLEAGGTIEQLLQSRQEEVSPPADTMPSDGQLGEGVAPANDPAGSADVVDVPGGIVTVGSDTIFAPLPPVPFLVEGLHIAPGRPTLVAGYGYSGKTLCLQSMALSIVTGKPVWGVYQGRRGRALHLDYEQGSRLSFRRYQRLAAAMGVTKDDVGNALRAAVYPTIGIDDDNAEDLLTRAIDGFDFVICDSFTAATQHIDENSSESGRPLYMLGRISEKTGATIVVVHHARKPKGDDVGGARMAIRGSGAIYGASDSVFCFSAEKGEMITVSDERSPETGVTMPTFGLSIEDVAIGDDPRGGLRVLHHEGEQLRESKAARVAAAEDAKRDRQSEKLRDHFRKHGPVYGGGKTALCAIIGGNKEDTTRAFETLKSAGELVVGGSYHEPTVTWRGVP